MIHNLRFLIPDDLKQRLLYPGYYWSVVKSKFDNRYFSGLEIISAGYKNEFGGYFNLPIGNKLGDVLFQGTDQTASSWPPKGELAICIRESGATDARTLAYSRAWNWQQGAFLRWFSEDLLCFNDYDSNTKTYCVKIMDKQGRLVRQIDSPLGAIDFSGSVGVSYSFERLAILREDYGYFAKELSNEREILTEPIAFSLVDLNSGGLVHRVSFDDLRDITEVQPENDKVNHFEFSPDGKKVAYLYRYWVDQVKITKMMVFDLEKKSHTVIGNEKFYSHFCWIDTEQILVFGQLEEENKFFVINCVSQKKFIPDFFVPPHDSHPATKTGKRIVFDSYPSFFRKSNILVVDTVNGTRTSIGRYLHHPTFRGVNRVDHHPRFNQDERRVYIDLPLGRERKFGVIQL
ncbi:hypothetical protein [Cyclobacterium xiamenense]|uniref:hypothetical protein n=1 Tax=Cyclobacterium xiamenense TaxID=1297121 RepID=UPI0012B8EAF8|nr:hypothetical protein [Cyclobacterium xiamenense]